MHPRKANERSFETSEMQKSFEQQFVFLGVVHKRQRQ